jgi:hypothetical protein
VRRIDHDFERAQRVRRAAVHVVLRRPLDGLVPAMVRQLGAVVGRIGEGYGQRSRDGHVVLDRDQEVPGPVPPEPLQRDHFAAGAAVDELPADVTQVQRRFSKVRPACKINDLHGHS